MQTLKEFRLHKGIKQSAVAEHLGVTRQTYSSYEKHQERMSIDQAKAVCEFLGCSVGDIFLPSNVN